MKITSIIAMMILATGVCQGEKTKPQFGADDWLPSETDPVGFAGQGNNWYPGANPPAEFWEGTPTMVKVMHEKKGRIDGYKSLSGPYDKELLVPGYADSKSKNILWKMPTPGWSTSSPIVIGKRVISLHSPHYVVCRDTDTGKILWQDELKLMLLPKLVADRKSLEPVPANALNLQLLHEFGLAVNRLTSACNPGLHKGNIRGEERKPLITLAGEVIKGMEQNKAALVKAFPESGPMIDAQIAEYRALMAARDGEDCRAGLKAFTEWADKQTGVPSNSSWPGWQISDTIATPVSDGKIVGVQFGQGQTAAYELETGKRLWAFRDPTMRATSVSHSPSPLLWKDLLIFNSGSGPQRTQSLLAVDKRNGQVRWGTSAGQGGSVIGKPHGHHMPHYLARLPGGKAVIVSNLGLVVDAETGKILIEKLPALPEARGGWGKGYVCGLGNLIAKSNGGGFETWQLKVGSTGILEVAAQSLMQFKKGEGPFALSDQLVVVIANRGGPAGHCLVDPVSGEVKGTVDYNTGATPTIAGKTLIFSEEDVNPNGRERQDRMCLCRFGTFDMSDPSKSTLLSEKSLLGTAAMPADIADKYFPAIANNPDLKALMLGGYHGVAPGFGLYMAGVTAHGNRLFILSQSHLYCIGSEALGSPKDDPAIIAAIAAAKNATELTKYLQTERPRYRRDALLGLANLKLPLNAEQQKQVQDLMINDPFEEVRAASILALDVEKDAGAKQFLNAFIKAQKAKKPSEEDKLTSVMLLTAQELGATYFQDRLPVALVANKEFVARQALFMIASNVRLFTPPIIEAAMETLKEPNFITPRTERIHVLHQQNVADYLGLASAKDPRTMTALRKSGLDPVQLMPVLCHRLPIEELPSFIDEMVRSGKNMGYVWSQGSQASWFSRICYRMGPAKAIPVLEKLKTDKPDMAGQLQDIINGLTAK